MINKNLFLPAGEGLCEVRANNGAKSEQIDDKNFHITIASTVAKYSQWFIEQNDRHFENHVIQ